MYLHNFFYYSTYYINFPLAPVIHKYASINILNLIKYFLIENCPFSNYKRNIKSIIKKRVKGLGGWLLFECFKHQIVTRMRFLLMHACAAHAELLQYPDCLLIINKRGSPWSQEKKQHRIAWVNQHQGPPSIQCQILSSVNDELKGYFCLLFNFYCCCCCCFCLTFKLKRTFKLKTIWIIIKKILRGQLCVC